MIKLKGVRNLLVKSNIRSHEILSDTSLSNGGQDEGMNPHELLETALAACTSMTLKMYAQRKNMKLNDVLVEVNTVSEGKESVLSRKITLLGELTADETKRLMEIADKCPIHKLLTSQITIQSQLLT